MKTKFTIFLLPILAGLAPFSAFGQTIIQHIGAADPVDEGFFRSEFGADVGPVLGDFGLASWSFDASGGWRLLQLLTIVRTTTGSRDTGVGVVGTNAIGHFQLLSRDRLCLWPALDRHSTGAAVMATFGFFRIQT